jgi:hypothetical protein
MKEREGNVKDRKNEKRFEGGGINRIKWFVFLFLKGKKLKLSLA